MNKLIFFVIAFVFFSAGCISDYDGALPDTDPIPVLNSVLCTDSILALNLTWSNQPQEKKFEPIPGAEFILKKNGFLLSSDFSFNPDGTYLFNDTCLNGDEYEIEVQIQGYPKLTSQTVIPYKPTISIERKEGENNQRPAEIFELAVANISKEINALYVFLFVRETNYSGNQDWNQRGIYCDSPFADPFNRFYDSWAPEGFSYEYESFVRIPAENLVKGSLHSRLAFFWENENIRFYVIAATKEYDLYCKGGYLQRSFNPEVNLPFTYQPIFLPSNISGGAGIFAGIDLSLFEFNSEI